MDQPVVHTSMSSAGIGAYGGERANKSMSLSPFSQLLLRRLILDTDVVEDGRDSPEAIIGVHVSNFMRLN